MILFGIVSWSFHRSPFSVVAALVPRAEMMAKRSRQLTDEASKYTVASSKPKPEGKGVLALAEVRHPKSSPSISADETTPSDVKGQERTQARHWATDSFFPGPSGNPEVTEPGPPDVEGEYWMPKTEQ